LSGLYAGKLEGHALKELRNYASKFLGAEYTADRIDVLYECFRHKVAHLAQPYAVFDTQSKPKTFGGQGRRLITWTVRASGKARSPARSTMLSPDDAATNPLKRLLTALCYRLGATLAAGAIAIPLEPVPGIDLAYDVAVPIALIWYWFTFFRGAYRTMSHIPSQRAVTYRQSK
jgi:hypothetical protein